MDTRDLDLGLRIKLARVSCRLAQRELARRASLSPTILSNIENNWRLPTQEEIVRICAVLGIRPEQLGKCR